MPIVKNFKSTQQWKAFTLNSIASALVVVIAITTKQYLDRLDFYDKTSDKNKKLNIGYEIASITITLLVTFSTSMIVFLIMFLLFGFGGGMITTD